MTFIELDDIKEHYGRLVARLEW